MTRYPYSKLPPDGASIRLLHLLPAKQARDILQCNISDYNLKQIDKIGYEALSYVWGDENKTVDIALGDHSLPVTVNLDTALRALRQADDERILWVDALCINQLDLTEKSAQVQIMWYIYGEAECVVAWIGVHQDNSEDIMAQLARREVQQTPPTRMQRPETGRAECLQNNVCPCVNGNAGIEAPHPGIMSILTREWFTRIWTLQEIAAAQRVVFVCGNSTVDGKAFYDGIRAVASQHWDHRQTLRRIRPGIELIGPPGTAFYRYKSPLVALIERFRSWNATKSVDKVYSLLAFSSDARQAPELLPDYRQTPYDLACKIIRFTYPSAAIIDCASETNSVTFEIDGYVLGKVSSPIEYSDRKTWKFGGPKDLNMTGQPGHALDPVAVSMFQQEWMIDILNERNIVDDSTICILRGAVRPTSITMDAAGYIMGMLATTEPYQEQSNLNGLRECGSTSWSDVVRHFATAPEGAINLRLTWDPFRQPLPSEVSSYTVSSKDLEVP